ncbi:hypothetical protein D1871_09835 [Nakamurella silvestris]|nr:hypothetical protein D1871_09835 [Nakamurella silvestris]
MFSDPSEASSDPVAVLERWERFGATWRVVERTSGSVTISLCRCDGGEEVQRLRSHSPALLRWLAGRTSSQD